MYGVCVGKSTANDLQVCVILFFGWSKTRFIAKFEITWMDFYTVKPDGGSVIPSKYSNYKYRVNYRVVATPGELLCYRGGSSWDSPPLSRTIRHGAYLVW